jgi:transglutaminase-like putative cysteine protease
MKHSRIQHWHRNVALKSACLVVFSLWSVLSVLAAEDYSQGILDVREVVKAAESVTGDRYPNADSVLVEDHIVTTYETDGRAVMWDDTFFKVLTPKGKDDRETLTEYFTLPYGTVAFTLVQVIKPGGAVIPVDVERQGRVMVDRSKMAANIYNPNDKVLQVGVPGLEVGDLVRYVARRECVKPLVPGTWSAKEVLESRSPIRHFVYEVLAPKELPLRSIALKSEVKGTVSHTRGERQGRLYYRWELQDVPRMYEEPNMPPLHTVAQRLLLSTIPTWADVSKWYWSLCEPHLTPTPAMGEKVSELTKGIEGREAKVRSVFRFVSQEVRYMGIIAEKEAPGWEPHDVGMTFANRYGVCRDKAALLVAMLRLAGLSAFPVAIENGARKDDEVPQPYFNHAIAAVDNGEGTYLLMDPTDESTKDLFPAYLCNQSYLVARPEGDRLRTSPIIPADQNLVRIETRASLNASGNLVGESALHFDGVNDNLYRGYLSKKAPEERRQHFEGLLKRVAAGARITAIEIKPEDMRDTEAPLEVRLSYEARDVLIANDTTVMLPFPRFGTSVGVVNFILDKMDKTGLEARKYPLKTDVACGVRETLQLDLAPSLGKLEVMPQYPTLQSDTLSWRRQVRQDGDTFYGESEFLLKAVEFDPQQYLALKDALKTIEVNDRKRPILRRSPSAHGEAPDAVVLEDRWEYDVKDLRNWTETRTLRMQLLTYKGVKDNAEWKWTYNPVWEDVKLEKATVTNGSQVRAISQEEINLMDVGWVASAPRYPAAKTLVASLPGVEVGSVIDLQIVQTYRDQPFFGIRQSFRYFDPIQKMTVRLTAPSSLPLAVGRADAGFGPAAGRPAAPSLGERRSEGDGRVVYEWTAENQASIVREQYLPFVWSYTPTVWVSGGRWEDYAKEVRAALLRAATGQAAAAAQARSLSKGGGPSRATAIAIRDFVAKKVRNAGPTLYELPLSAVTEADRTLADGYGDSADRAVLLYAMLAEAGFRPEFLLASEWTVVDSLLPAIRDYPRAATMRAVLVRIEVDGQIAHLNDTDQYAAMGATVHDGVFALSLEDGQPSIIRAAPGMGKFEEAQYDLKIAEDGEAQITKTVRYYGDAYARMRRRFAWMPPEERRRYHQEALAEISQWATGEGELVTDFESHPGVESFTARVKGFALKEGKYLAFDLPASPPQLYGLGADKRTNPLCWEEPRRSRTAMTVHLPAAAAGIVLAPQSMEWTAPGHVGTVTIRRDDLPGSGADGTPLGFRLTQEVSLRPAVLDPAFYGELLEANRQLSHPRAKTVLVTMGPQ